jgi:hypothetical protein
MTEAGQPAQVAPSWPSSVSSALSAGLALEAEAQQAVASRQMRATEDWAQLYGWFTSVGRPVLEGVAHILQDHGIGARVDEVVRDRPVGVPRAVELQLVVNRFATRGPSRLAVTCLEGNSTIRADMVVEPTGLGGIVLERSLRVELDQWSEDLVGVLTVTLLDLLWDRAPQL